VLDPYSRRAKEKGLVERAGFEPAISCSQITRRACLEQDERIRVDVARLVLEGRDPIASAHVSSIQAQ
jgi:hypothetical protein